MSTVTMTIAIAGVTTPPRALRAFDAAASSAATTGMSKGFMEDGSCRDEVDDGVWPSTARAVADDERDAARTAIGRAEAPRSAESTGEAG
ncbi:hypothetical protein GCM10027515_17210 [Schumannella luteola]